MFAQHGLGEGPNERVLALDQGDLGPFYLAIVPLGRYGG
jgi:hypothetical protein